MAHSSSRIPLPSQPLLHVSELPKAFVQPIIPFGVRTSGALLGRSALHLSLLRGRRTLMIDLDPCVSDFSGLELRALADMSEREQAQYFVNAPRLVRHARDRGPLNRLAAALRDSLPAVGESLHALHEKLHQPTNH